MPFEGLDLKVNTVPVLKFDVGVQDCDAVLSYRQHVEWPEERPEENTCVCRIPQCASALLKSEWCVYVVLTNPCIEVRHKQPDIRTKETTIHGLDSFIQDDD